MKRVRRVRSIKRSMVAGELVVVSSVLENWLPWANLALSQVRIRFFLSFITVTVSMGFTCPAMYNTSSP